ncbi:cytochrome c oxidase subunit IV [Obba rivulosa]|uniref:Cytochrome c oxidase subunit IV n=1 Tax=Obba rivulosa TaxID=1052685 RepID=A0A8E2AVE7_9APHY|nr:cytochrome c oxidase subunit IV [Obba rivulosa]
MQALRLARPRALPRPFLARSIAAASPAHATAAAPVAPHLPPEPIIPLSNVEAQWERLSPDEQLAVHQQLEELQKKDWKTLSIDEKKAAYYVAFGPHGPRAPTHKPGDTVKLLLGTLAGIAVAGGVFAWFRSRAPPPPRSLTKEWEEASNELAREQKMNPISGISSEGYKGKGFVTHK